MMFGLMMTKHRLEELDGQLATAMRRIDGLTEAAARRDAELDAIRRQLDAASATLEDQGSRNSSVTLTDAFAPFVDGQTTLGDHVGAMSRVIDDYENRLSSDDAQSNAADLAFVLHARAIKALHVELSRMSCRIDLDAESNAKTAAALFERFETHRR